MPSNHTGKLLRSAPYFPVADVLRSTAYYVEVLGFRAEYQAGPEFSICSRDDLAVMLRRVGRPELIVPSEKQGGTWDAFFWVDDAKALHTELVSKGADVVYGPIIEGSYKMLEFAVRDCDGHILGFGEAIGN